MIRNTQPPLDELHDLLGESSPDKRMTHKLMEMITKKSLISILEDYPNGGKEAMGKESIKKLDIRILEKIPTLTEEERVEFRKLSEQLNEWSIAIDEHKGIKEEFVRYAHEHPKHLSMDPAPYNELLQNVVNYVRKSPEMRRYKLPQDGELIKSLRKYFATKVEHGERAGLKRLDAHIALFITSEIDSGDIKSITQIIKKKGALLKDTPEKILFSGYFTTSLKQALLDGVLFPLELKGSTPRKSDKKVGPIVVAEPVDSDPVVLVDPIVVDSTTPDTDPEDDTTGEVIKNVNYTVHGNRVRVAREKSTLAGLVAVIVKGPTMSGYAMLPGSPFSAEKGWVEFDSYHDGDHSIKLIGLTEKEDDKFDKIGEPVEIIVSLDYHKKKKSMDDISQDVTDAISSTFSLSDDTKDTDDEVDDTVTHASATGSAPVSTAGGSHTPPPPPDDEDLGTPPPEPEEEPEAEEVVEPLTEAEKQEAKMEIALAYAYPLTKAHGKKLKKDFSKRFHPDKREGGLEVTQFLNNLHDERMVSLDKIDLRYIQGKDYIKVLVHCVNNIKRNISLNSVENSSLIKSGGHAYLHAVLSVVFKRAMSAGVLKSVIHGYTYTLSEPISPLLIEEIWEEIRARRATHGGTHAGTGGAGTHGGGHTTHGTGHTTHGTGTGPTDAPEEDLAGEEDTETLMEFATDWTTHSMREDAKYKKEELIKFTMEFYDAIVRKRDAVVTGTTEKYDEAIGYIQYNGLNNIYVLKQLLSSGMAIDPKISTKFLRVLKDVENSQTEKSIKYINKIQKNKLYTDLYNQRFESETYTTREEQNYKTMLKSLLMKEKFEEKEYGYVFLGKLASLITNPDYKNEEAAEEVLKTYFESRKKHYYTKFGIWTPPTNGATVEEFFKQREDVNMTEVVKPWMAGSFEIYWKEEEEKLKATREKDPNWLDKTYAWFKYKSSVLFKGKKERKQELDKKVRQADSWKIMKGTVPASINYTGNPRLAATNIQSTKLEMNERGIPKYTLEGTAGFVGKVYQSPVSDAYRMESIFTRVVNDVDLNEAQKRVACTDFVRHCVSIATMKLGDLRGSVNGKNITIANSLGGYPQVIVDGKILIDSELGLRNMTIDYNELLEKLVTTLGFLRHMITEKAIHHDETMKNLSLDNIKLSKAHKKLSKHEKIWKEVIKEAGGTREVWHVPETGQESLHCFHIVKSGSNDIYYSNGKFYIVRGVGTTQRVTEAESFQKLLQEIDAKDRSDFLTNYSKRFVINYLKEKASEDTRIFFNMHGSDYSLRLDDAGSVITEAIADRGGQLKEFYSHTELGKNTGDDKRRVKDNLSNYANQKQWVYNSQKDRGIAIVDYRQVDLKRSKWYKKPEEEVIDIRNDDDLAIATVPLGDSYNNFYGDVEFIQALVKLADKTIS